MYLHTILGRKTLAPCLTALALAFTGLSAHAQGFAGIGVGQSRADIDCTGTLTCDRTDTAWKLYGGYMFHPNFGGQAEIYRQGRAKFSASLGDGTTATGEFKGEGVGLYGLAIARDGIWSVFGKAGVLSSRITGAARIQDLSASRRETHTHFGWLSCQRFVWKNTDPNLTFPFHKTCQSNTSGLNLARCQETFVKCFDGKTSEREL
jgi:OOP family OmpA-OmpF porin